MGCLAGFWGAVSCLADKDEGFQGQAPLVYQLLFELWGWSGPGSVDKSQGLGG